MEGKMKAITKKDVDAYVDAYIALDKANEVLEGKEMDEGRQRRRYLNRCSDSAEDLEKIAEAVGKSITEREEIYVNPYCDEFMTHRLGFDYRGVAFYVLSDTLIKNFDGKEEQP